MATLKSNFGIRAALASVAAVGIMTGPAQADDRSADYTTSSTVTQQERSDLATASSQAREFAKSGFNIAIVLRVGQDMPNAKFQSQEQLGEVFRNRYQELLNQEHPDQQGEVAVYYAPNPDGNASLMTVRTGDQLYQVDNSKFGRSEDFDSSILDLSTAWAAAPEVVEHLPLKKALQLQNERDGYTTTASLDYALPN